MNSKTLISAACFLLCCVSLNGQFAPENIRGLVLHSVATSAPPYPWNQTLGKTTVGITSRTGTTYSTFLEGNDEVIQTGINYSYAKRSANVGAFTVWIPALAEFATTLYTFTSPDSGTLSSTTSIGTISGTFKLYKTWSWQDQANYWDQATEAQNAHILANPSLLGLYNQTQLDTSVSQAKDGLYSQAQLDQAKLDAKAGLFTQAQLDAAVDAAAAPKGYFLTEGGWEESDNASSFIWKLRRSTDLSDWETVGEAQVSFSGESLPTFIKIEVD